MTNKEDHIPTDNLQEEAMPDAQNLSDVAADALTTTDLGADNKDADASIEEVITVKRKDSVNSAKKWRWKNPFRLTIIDRYILGKFL